VKVKLRKDLALEKESIPVLNHDNMMFNEERINDCTFLYQCDETGQVALKDIDGRLIVLYGIDLDFEVMSMCNWCGDDMKEGLWESHKCIEPKEEDNA